MTQDEIQAVARAICKEHKLDCDLPEDMADYETDNEWFDWTDVAQAAIAALDAARGKAEPVARALTDPQRMLWKDDVEGICPSIDLCFEYGNTARCWPCAAKQSASLGVSVDTSQPNLPEVSRLRRELKAQGDRVARVVEWLRACSLSSAIPDDPAQMIDDLADAIERGEPFNG